MVLIRLKALEHDMLFSEEVFQWQSNSLVLQALRQFLHLNHYRGLWTIYNRTSMSTDNFSGDRGWTYVDFTICINILFLYSKY